MEQTARVHVHPVSGEEVYGNKLESHDIIRKNDLFSSTSGHWMTSSFVGHSIMEADDVIYVRPEEGM